MKKQLILILFLLGNLTTSFSQFQKTAFDNLVGTYDDFTITKDGVENSNNVKVELTADFNVKITEDFDGLLVEHINQKVNPQVAGFDKDENYLFDFKPTSKQNEFNAVRITIYKEPIFPNTEFNMSIGYTKGEKEEYFLFGIKKDGGNPKQPNKNIDFSDIYQSVLYTNKIEKNTYGAFKVEWYPSHDIGYLRFKHLKNFFKITKIEHGYLLQNENQDNIELEYKYGYGKKKWH